MARVSNVFTGSGFGAASPAASGARSRATPIVLAIAVAFGVVVADARADGPVAPVDRGNPEARWSASFGLLSGLTVNNEKGDLETDCEDPCRPTDTTMSNELRPAADGDDRAVSPFVGGSLQVMSPAVPFIPGSPRFFVSGEYLPTFAVKRDLARDGDPGTIDFGIVNNVVGEGNDLGDICQRFQIINSPVPGLPPRVVPELNCAQVRPEIAASGQGAKTTSQVDRDMFSAAIGAAFPLQLWGHKLRIKPSVGWLRYVVEVNGVVNRAIKNDPDILPIGGNFGDQVRIVEIRASKSEAFHAFGPGLEVELELPVMGPVQPTLFASGNAYRIIGNRKIKFSETLTIDGGTTSVDFLAENTYTGDFSAEVKPWIFRGAIGARVWWIGN